ncbi:hypothetical protein BaRGS_00007717 [Batillaria attramentaria]|uniref:Uncharacterized protein n=1 Tax=Batillaria attramentaria TaxID=370345 RepID=A0ABD0LPH0_9CAEN
MEMNTSYFCGGLQELETRSTFMFPKEYMEMNEPPDHLQNDGNWSSRVNIKVKYETDLTYSSCFYGKCQHVLYLSPSQGFELVFLWGTPGTGETHDQTCIEDKDMKTCNQVETTSVWLQSLQSIESVFWKNEIKITPVRQTSRYRNCSRKLH